MKKLIVFALVCLVLWRQPQALAVVCVLAAWAAIFWVFKKIGILSAPRKMSNAAGRATYNGIMNWFRGPSQAEIRREQERKQAKKDYAFHSAQAKKYAGTRDGAWHADMAQRARNKMR